ncbi:hypothetical protein Bolokhovo_3 [Bacillus phage Bolokhovo]|uniref:Uncharacterized protein n=1 Tax=Bacillus phage Bolokhovo TaxID=2743970 RepID=A0A7D7KJ23_9CAUD|nr:hypothetical protein Bolokhovo_3 [Bacillus phage Bolokhovo]
MHTPDSLQGYLNNFLWEQYPTTNLKVYLKDTSEHSSYYGFALEDGALDCAFHPLNIKQRVLDEVCEQASTLTGLKVKVIQKGILVYHNSKEVH